MGFKQKAKLRKILTGVKVSERIDAALQFHKEFPEESCEYLRLLSILCLRFEHQVSLLSILTTF
jgi:hypothetical protein